jgi:hypothetical protein
VVGAHLLGRRPAGRNLVASWRPAAYCRTLGSGSGRSCPHLLVALTALWLSPLGRSRSQSHAESSARYSAAPGWPGGLPSVGHAASALRAPSPRDERARVIPTGSSSERRSACGRRRARPAQQGNEAGRPQPVRGPGGQPPAAARRTSWRRLTRAASGGTRLGSFPGGRQLIAGPLGRLLAALSFSSSERSYVNARRTCGAFAHYSVAVGVHRALLAVGQPHLGASSIPCRLEPGLEGGPSGLSRLAASAGPCANGFPGTHAASDLRRLETGPAQQGNEAGRPQPVSVPRGQPPAAGRALWWARTCSAGVRRDETW